MLIKLLEYDRCPEGPVHVLGVALLVIVLFQVISCQFICRPVETGLPVSFTCDCSNEKDSQVYWTLGGQLDPLICDRNYSSAGPSTDGAPRLVTVTYDQQQRTSTLVINGISADDDRKYVRCVASEPGLGLPPGRTVSECMLQLYRRPSSVTCGAEQVKRRTVRFGCTARQVFPGLDCSVTYREIYTGNLKDLQYGSAWTRTKTALPSGDFNASCYLDIEPIPVGTYEFFGVVRSSLLTNLREAVVAVPPTAKISVLNSTTKVHVRRTTQINQTEVCAEAEHDVSFRCDAEGFYKQPSIFLMVDRTNTKIDGALLKTGSSYVTQFTMRATAAHNRSKIFCVAKESDFDNLTTDSTEIGIKWLQPFSVIVSFESQNKEDRLQNTFLFRVNQNASFTCGVADATRSISKITAKCVYENVTLLNREVNAAEISVNVPNITEHRLVKCVCSAVHKSGCSVNSLAFQMKFTQVDDESSLKMDSVNSSSDNVTHFFILLGCACAVLFPLLVYVLFRLGRSKKQMCCRSERPSDHYENIMAPNTNGVSHFPRHEIQRLTAEDIKFREDITATYINGVSHFPRPENQRLTAEDIKSRDISASYINGVCHFPRPETQRLTAEDTPSRDSEPSDLYVNHHQVQNHFQNRHKASRRRDSKQ